MGVYEENRRLDDLVHAEEEKRRKEEAKRKRAEAEKKRKDVERQRKERDARRRERDERLDQSERHRIIAEYTGFDTENSFSPKPNSSGIIKPSKPQFSSIGEIQDAQKTQKKLIDDLHKKQWDDLVAGTDDLAKINTQNVEKAKQGLIDLNHELTAAYGLGENGYWNKNRKLDDEVHSVGQQPMTPSQKVVQPTNKPSTSYTPPKNVWEVDDWAMHGKQPTEQQKPTNKPISPNQGILDDMFNAGGKGMPEAEEERSDEALGSYLDDMFNAGGKWSQSLSDTGASSSPNVELTRDDVISEYNLNSPEPVEGQWKTFMGDTWWESSIPPSIEDQQKLDSDITIQGENSDYEPPKKEEPVNNDAEKDYYEESQESMSLADLLSDAIDSGAFGKIDDNTAANLYMYGEKYLGGDSYTGSIIEAIINNDFEVGTNLLIQFALQFDGKEDFSLDQLIHEDEWHLPYSRTYRTNLDQAADCSSFARMTYDAFFGIDIGGTTLTQWWEGFGSAEDANGDKLNVTKITKEELKPEDLEALRPGDLIYYQLPNTRHVAMYIGDGMMIHQQNTKEDVNIDPITNYSFKYIEGIARILTDEQYESLIVK